MLLYAYGMYHCPYIIEHVFLQLALLLSQVLSTLFLRIHECSLFMYVKRNTYYKYLMGHKGYYPKFEEDCISTPRVCHGKVNRSNRSYTTSELSESFANSDHEDDAY